MINREKFEAECRAAGLRLKGLNADGPEEGRAVLGDGTVVCPDGSLTHERADRTPDATAAAIYRVLRAAHDSGPTAEQAARAIMRDLAPTVEDPRLLAALALLAAPDSTEADRAWSRSILDEVTPAIRSKRGS